MGRGRSGRTSSPQPRVQRPQPRVQEPQPQQQEQQRRRTPQEWMTYFNTADDAQARAALNEWRRERMDADNRSNDTDVQRFFHNIGWSENTPEVLDERQYQAAVRAAGNPTQLYHADRAAGGVTAQQFAEQYFGTARDANGTPYRHYVSNGYYGGGTYFAEKARDSAFYGNNQFRGFLNNKARVVDYRTLNRQYNDYAARHPSFERMVGRMKAGYGGREEKLSVFAAMQGYNVIRRNNYYVILDRSATTVSSRTRNTGMIRGNW